jgi:hypothetical protein
VSNFDPSQEGEPQIDIRQYREAMERAAAAEKLAAEREKAIALKDIEHAVAMAGIPTGTGAGKAFVETYKGPTDEESVRAAAIEFGFWKPEGSDANDKRPADQAQVDADRAALQQAGSTVDPGEQPPPEHPGTVGLREFFKAKSEGQRSEDAAAHVIDRLVDAGVKGNPEVIIPNR